MLFKLVKGFSLPLAIPSADFIGRKRKVHVIKSSLLTCTGAGRQAATVLFSHLICPLPFPRFQPSHCALFSPRWSGIIAIFSVPCPLPLLFSLSLFCLHLSLAPSLLLSFSPSLRLSFSPSLLLSFSCSLALILDLSPSFPRLRNFAFPPLFLHIYLASLVFDHDLPSSVLSQHSQLHPASRQRERRRHPRKRGSRK